MKRQKLWPYATLLLVAVIADQAIKYWVEQHLPFHTRVELLPFLSLLHSRNTGVAFSLFSQVDVVWLGLLVVAITIFIAIIAMRTDPSQVFARFGFALIIGGALGNLIDRAIRGYVVDYIYFHTPVWSFAIFNLADALITIGAALVVFEEVLNWRRGRDKGRAGE